MRTLVAFYSRTGNNRYVASRLAADLGADLVELVPRVRAFPIMLTFALLDWSLRLTLSPSAQGYDKVIVCGPLWMGKFCLPGLDFLRSLRKVGARADVVVCCGSTDAGKDDKFGYAKVLAELRANFGAVLGRTQALPMALVLPESKKVDPQAVMQARLSDGTFTGLLASRYQSFVQGLC